MDIGDEEIKEWHLDRGWSDIGYHVIIRRDGNVQYGRPFDVPGAHVYGHNSNSLGICMVGGVNGNNVPTDNFTDEQYDSLKTVLVALQMLFPDAFIYGHRDFPNVQKACPSFNVHEWLKKNGIPQHNR